MIQWSFSRKTNHPIDMSKDIWYSFTSPSVGTLTASTCQEGTSTDTIVGLFHACEDGLGELVGNRPVVLHGEMKTHLSLESAFGIVYDAGSLTISQTLPGGCGG